MIDRERPQVSFAAESEGLSYIELMLDPREGRNKQQTISYYGVKIAVEIPDGRDPRSGMPKSIVKISGGKIIFTLDEKRKAWFGDLLDDKEGYNRKFLASHIVSEKQKREEAAIKKKKPANGSRYAYHVIDEKYGLGESPFKILDKSIEHEVFNIRKEMDGEVIDTPKLVTPLEEAQAKLAEMTAQQEKKEKQWEVEKAALLKLRQGNKHVTDITPDEIKSSVMDKAAEVAAELDGELGGIEKPEEVDA